MNVSQSSDIWKNASLDNTTFTNMSSTTANITTGLTFAGTINYWNMPLPTYSVVLLVILAFIPIIGSGNIVAFWFIVRSKQQRTPFNQVVAAMLVVNIIRCECLVFFKMAEIFSNSSFTTPWYCRVITTANVMSHNFGMVVSVIVAVLRAYVCVRQSILKLKPKHAWSMVFVSLCISGFIALQHIWNGRFQYRMCLRDVVYKGSNTTNHVFKLVLQSVMFIVVLISYLILAFYIKYKRANFQGNTKNLFTVKFGVTLSIVFAASYVIPYIFLRIQLYDLGKLDSVLIIQSGHIVEPVTFFDSVVFPVIIFCQNSDFKQFMVSLLRRSSNSVSPAENLSPIPTVVQNVGLSMESPPPGSSFHVKSVSSENQPVGPKYNQVMALNH